MQDNFKSRVYKIIRKIPIGKVATYSQIASLADHPKAARVIGQFMKHNPDIPATPCHRVIGSDGSLTGYSGNGGIKAKRQLLLREGVTFHNNKINLKVSLWKPDITHL